MKKGIRKRSEGYALVSVIVFFAVIVVLVSSILTFATSNAVMSIKDSEYQQLIYVAESGNNAFLLHLSNTANDKLSGAGTPEAVFEKFESSYMNAPTTIESFPDNPQWSTVTTLEPISSDSNSRTYAVKTIATNGLYYRSVEDHVTIRPTFEPMSEPFVSSTRFTFGGTGIYGEKQVMVTEGISTLDLNGGSLIDVSTMYFNSSVRMNGGSASLGSQNHPDAIYVNGDLDLWDGRRSVYGKVHVKGDFTLKDAILHHDVYVDGDVKLGWTPEIYGKVYYTGELTHPYGASNQQILDRLVKVAQVPDFNVPKNQYTLKSDAWYSNEGYNQGISYTGGVLRENQIPDGAKRFVDGYVSEHHTSPSGNITIVSKGDITIKNNRTISGLLLAPNGTVTLDIERFNGIIISKNGLVWTRGGSAFYARSLSDLFASLEDHPFDVLSESGQGLLEVEKSIQIIKRNKEI